MRGCACLPHPLRAPARLLPRCCVLLSSREVATWTPRSCRGAAPLTEVKALVSRPAAVGAPAGWRHPGRHDTAPRDAGSGQGRGQPRLLRSTNGASCGSLEDLGPGCKHRTQPSYSLVRWTSGAPGHPKSRQMPPSRLPLPRTRGQAASAPDFYSCLLPEDWTLAQQPDHCHVTNNSSNDMKASLDLKKERGEMVGMRRKRSSTDFTQELSDVDGTGWPRNRAAR